jgi:hypothetical protein
VWGDGHIHCGSGFMTLSDIIKVYFEENKTAAGHSHCLNYSVTSSLTQHGFDMCPSVFMQLWVVLSVSAEHT